MASTTLSEEDILFDLSLEVVPTDSDLDTTIYASHNGYICVPGSGNCTATCWNCYSVSRCCMRPV
ncbi:MAG: hypothetical protein HOZ81_40265 [Streptomyces sp.]|nr:hypothetical protein [Streptomyces sp.]NUT42425.1 hypothetical protein [Thermoactinospora sp.]